MDRIDELKKIKKELHSSGKKTRDFINSIVDEMSFVEMDTLYKSNLNDNPGEGVICGFARINEHPVYIFAQNFDVQKGLSKGQADKILKCMNNAEKAGYPIISVLNSYGAIVDDGLSSLEGYAQIISKSSSLYGVVPQICIINGECYGSLSYLAALSDFVFMMKDSSLCSSSPLVLAAKSGKSNDAKKLFGTQTHFEKTGLASRICQDAKELLTDINKLLDLINEDAVTDDVASLNKQCPKLNEGYSAKEIINGVFDKNSFFEICAQYGKELICGFARIAGLTIGAVISEGGDKMLTAQACKKASKFIRLIDSYNIPLVTFVDCEGTVLDLESEQNTLIKDAANLLSAVSDLESPKVSVICGKVAGFSYTALASKNIGFDYSFAWANASLNILPANVGAEILESEKISAAKNPKNERKAIEEKLENIDGNPVNAANRGYIDNIIEPSLTRSYLLSVLLMLS